jgi:hypothetical protein
MISKWSSSLSLLWFQRSSTVIQPLTTKVSPDLSFIVYTNGVEIVTKISYTTGALILAKRMSKLEFISGLDISPNSLNILLGGREDHANKFSMYNEMFASNFNRISSYA